MHYFVATVDILGAFVQADMDDKVVHLRLHGNFVEELVQTASTLYRKYIQVMKVLPLLYLKLHKSLYGTLRADNLFWKRLSSQLHVVFRF